MNFPQLIRFVRRRPKIILVLPCSCNILQFGGTTLSTSFPKSPQFQYAIMPSLGEAVNLRILLHALIRRRLSRWGYYATFIEFTGAQLIISDRDTNIELFQLGEYISIPIWCCQNGHRLDLSFANSPGIICRLRDLSKTSTPRVSRYFVFGEASANLFDSILQTDFVITGSLKLNQHIATSKSRNTSSDQTGKKAIGLIASFPEKSDVPDGIILGNKSPFVIAGNSVVSYAEYFTIENSLIRALLSLASETGLSVAIIAKRPPHLGTEHDFFGSVSAAIDIPILSDPLRSSYEIAEGFDFLVTVDSTLGYEMLALGKKVAFVSSRFKAIGLSLPSEQVGHSLGWPSEGSFWTTADRPESIHKFLSDFVNISTESWEHIKSEMVPRLMVTDPGNRTFHNLLSAELGLQ